MHIAVASEVVNRLLPQVRFALSHALCVRVNLGEQCLEGTENSSNQSSCVGAVDGGAP